MRAMIFIYKFLSAIRPLVAESLYTDWEGGGRKDRYNEAKYSFSQFCKRA
jgi:hypothetical protein